MRDKVSDKWIDDTLNNFRYGISVHEALQELKERRESELRPATKFLGNTMGDQWEHLESEFDEANEEIRYISFNDTRANISKTAEELIDLQMSCETMLAVLNIDEQQRREARKKVIEKNRIRGYYEVSK